jgi:hypothetical protein
MLISVYTFPALGRHTYLQTRLPLLDRRQPFKTSSTCKRVSYLSFIHSVTRSSLPVFECGLVVAKTDEHTHQGLRGVACIYSLVNRRKYHFAIVWLLFFPSPLSLSLPASLFLALLAATSTSPVPLPPPLLCHRR